MADVIQFPSSRGRNWREFEGILRDFLATAGLSNHAQDWILTDLKPRFEALEGDARVSVNMPEQYVEQVREAVKTLTDLVHQTANAGLREMLSLELELYFALHPDQSARPRPI